METSTGLFGSHRWTVMMTALAFVTLATAFGPLADGEWVQPRVLFSVVTVTSLVCVLGATIVIALADRREMAEVGLLGTMLMAASVMPSDLAWCV